MLSSRLEKFSVFSKGFRGLPDGWHNLRSCNFLVGENSTGKSSFLQLLEIIDSRQHIMFFGICGISSGIDTPFDVCSRVSDAKETTIGFLMLRNEGPDHDSKENPAYGRLITYKRYREEFFISKITIVSEGRILSFKRTPNQIQYIEIPYDYSSKVTHTENAKFIEEFHYKAAPGFKKLETVDWESSFEATAWHRAIRKASYLKNEKAPTDLIQFDLPLNFLQYGPLRGKTNRVHYGDANGFSSTGEHFPYLIKGAILEDDHLVKSIDNFGKESGLFDKISVTSVKTKVPDKPFTVQIEKSGSHYYIDELGFGVGQILPIVADIAITPVEFSFLIQQPELHLHPRAQASLGNIFLEAVKQGRLLVIETHSDFIIDRFRLELTKSKMKQRSQIVYFEKCDETKLNRSYEIELRADGTFSEVPDAYRDFFVNESIKLFECL